jgi:rubrerythrin
VLDEVQGLVGWEADHVQFFAAGATVRGTFHCSDCGYGIAVQSYLPRCPMCDGSTWERGLAAFGAASRLARLDA